MDKKMLIKNTVVLSAAAILIGGVLATKAAFDDKAATAEQTYRCGSAYEQGVRGQNLSDEDKAKLEATREDRRQEAESRRTAVDAAITANDYQAFITAVGTDSPMAQKVTVDNFASFSEAHKLMSQARDIMTSIGLEDGPGMGQGHGQGRGMGMGRGMINR